MSDQQTSPFGPYERQIGTFAPVPRYAHGSRVPGWDDAADLDKDPAAVPDPATTPVPADLRAEIEGHMAKYPDRRSAAIPALAAVQRHYGWCTPQGIDEAACVMALTPAYLSAVATFYDMLETEPVGDQTIYVCTNISCSLRGADALLARVREETDADARFNVRGFECLGACDIAPMASINGAYIGPIELREVPELIAALREGREPLPDKALLKRPSADSIERPAHPSAPLPPEPSAFGAQMSDDRPTAADPIAAIEDPPEHHESDDTK
jgi:NADH-quinone oxidoreductase subunit E